MIIIHQYYGYNDLTRGIFMEMSSIYNMGRHAAMYHDLEPPRGRDGLKRRKAARRNVGELQVLRDGEVARETDSCLNRDDVEESEHRRAALFVKCLNYI